MRVRITLGVLCSATGTANPTFPPYEHGDVRFSRLEFAGAPLKRRVNGKLYYESIHKLLFEQT